jgi:predicted site-specific integrase-resolvase
MKLSDYAKQIGVSYKTVWRMWKRGELKGEQLPSGTVNDKHELETRRAVIYARVSSAENKSNLEAQAERLQNYCTARGYQIVKVVKEVGSGVNDNRRRLSDDYTLIVCEHKDRLTRVGFNYIKVLLNKVNKDIEVVNLAEERKDDFVSIITSFCARLYSLRRRSRKTECLQEEQERESCRETLN